MTDTIESAIHNLLILIGEDPDRNGLIETPSRVVRSLLDMTKGYQENPAEILSTRFDVDYSGIVVLEDINFSSLCEHHLMPFWGNVSISYMPNNHVIGVSKLVRLVDCFSQRLQVQERLTTQIANAIEEHLGLASVIVKAQHACMLNRGVRHQGVMTTIAGNLTNA